ncbi:MAG: hypothetical protein N2C14_31570, partial [Planctomycetales bacterium]
YQPAPPKLTSKHQGVAFVDDAAFEFQAQVAAQTKGVQFAAVLEHIHQGKAVASKRWTSGDPLEISQALELAPGENVVNLTITNVGANDEAAEQETVRKRIVIYRRVVKAVAEIDLQVVQVAATEAGVPVVSGKATIVTVPQVRIQGVVTGNKPLAAAEHRVEGADDGVMLSGFEAGESKEFKFNQTVALKPGAQTFLFRAKAGDGEFATAKAIIEYHPPTPSLEIISPASGRKLYAGRDGARVQAACRILLPADRQPYEVALLVNGKESADAPQVDEKKGIVRGEASLEPGENRIQFQVRNPWGSALTSAVTVAYLRPPKIVSVAQPKLGKTPVVAIVAIIESATDLLGAEVAGRPIDPEVITFDPDAKRWTVLAENVPLERGENTVSVMAWNADGRALQAGVVEITWDPPPPPKPHIDVIGRDAVVVEPDYELIFTVRSESAPRSIRVVRDGELLYQSKRLGEAKPNAKGLLEITEQVKLRLETGLNQFLISTINDGGERSATVNINYLKRPVQIVIEKIVSESDPDGAGIPVARSHNRLQALS